jgi:hypothetical protein
MRSLGSVAGETRCTCRPLTFFPPFPGGHLNMRDEGGLPRAPHTRLRALARRGGVDAKNGCPGGPERAAEGRRTSMGRRTARCVPPVWRTIPSVAWATTSTSRAAWKATSECRPSGSSDVLFWGSAPPIRDRLMAPIPGEKPPEPPGRPWEVVACRNVSIMRPGLQRALGPRILIPAILQQLGRCVTHEPLDRPPRTHALTLREPASTAVDRARAFR